VRATGPLARRSRALSAGAAVVCVACASSPGPRYETAYAAAARAESAGRLAEALDGFDRAATLGHRKGDADEARWAAVEVLQRQGRVADAVARLDAMARDATSERQGQAAYLAASLRIEHGDEDRGWRDMEQVPRRFPGGGVGHPAVRRLVEHADAQGTKAGLDELAALEHDLGKTELAELVAYLSAEHLETLGDTQAARDAYARMADRWPYPYGAFFDGALWKASLLDEQLGQPRTAVDDLEKMVAVRETTSLMGSYERKHYVPAMLRMGALYRDKLGDHVKARATFHRLYTDFAHSTMRDDALWLEAALWRQDGDAHTACDRLGTLVHEFPDSRYVPCATAQCEGLSRPKDSGAPKECRAYLQRAGWEPAAQ
jgi:tetratricopeptide (TPR) repeat protein